MLILGGTGWLGGELALAAHQQGWQVTCLARGTKAEPPSIAEFICEDRNQKTAYDKVSNQQWDCVIDLATQPGHVRGALESVPAAYRIFVSTNNVYAAFDNLEQPEDAPTCKPLESDISNGPQEYGPAKRADELMTLESGDPALIVRSGLIAGRGDNSGRTGYWPWRFANPVNNRVCIPDDPDLPVAMIDVVDLVSWILRQAAERTTGIFNVTGATTSFADVIALAAKVSNSEAETLPVPVQLVAELGIQPWSGKKSFPLWIDEPSWRYFPTLNCDAAMRTGLTRRPLVDTLQDVLAYETSRGGPVGAGLCDGEERDLQKLVMNTA